MHEPHELLLTKWRAIVHWRPNYRPMTIAVLVSHIGFFVGVGLLSLTAFFTMPWMMTLPMILVGLLITPPFGLLSFRFLEFQLYVFRVKRCLSDGSAEYLMPGAFTHVVIHEKFPGEVILIKRGDKALVRYVGRLGPRHANESEWAMYRKLRELGVAVETKFLTRMRIGKIRLCFGRNIQHQAIMKGEARFVADQQLVERVEIYTQRRGLTLSEFLVHRGDERRRINKALADLTRTLWAHGIVDLDVALRNYLIPLNEKGKPIKRRGEYEVLCHDFSCIYELPAKDGKSISRWLSMYGEVGNLGKAALDHGACLIRSLVGRQERGVARILAPDAPWEEIRPLFDQKKDAVPIAKRLRHHTNLPVVNRAKQALAIAIDNAIHDGTNADSDDDPIPASPIAK